ncbi:NAD(P)/FAD-dependent oxidoreductase [Chryseobacterium gwangjuense]|uniref:NAD(P)/FAD-dependent oxidoreductase n=1 Tax=Chryseobacterium gwangjuense TaxID=1069980 RepID=UPI001E5F4EDB|nr:NAD(P)/FAD-dependent oxidoreductase [Chryseobacterium gwangjuense]MCE3076242.1 NAD(P)/FAD-dependent oxidoreductase [Chryseobacterium gwangjuense]
MADQNNLTRRKFIKQFGFGMFATTFPFPFKNFIMKTTTKQFDVIIIGGSYSGLAAAMALGRALKEVLVIDGGKPCNSQTPYSHNFLTQDGEIPAIIAGMGKNEVKMYNTVTFTDDLAVKGVKTEDTFKIETASGEKYTAKKLIFATGIKDIMPDIPGFSESWGISVLHCPYCHGYEVRNEKTGILGNGDYAYELSKMISNWTKDLTIYTNGQSTLAPEQVRKLESHNIKIVEKEIKKLDHINGHIQNMVFNDDTVLPLTALYSPRPFIQHCSIPEVLGCEVTEDGYLKVNGFQETSIYGIYASGDNTTRMRTVANAVATGTTAGIAASKKLILEQF